MREEDRKLFSIGIATPTASEGNGQYSGQHGQLVGGMSKADAERALAALNKDVDELRNGIDNALEEAIDGSLSPMNLLEMQNEVIPDAQV